MGYFLRYWTSLCQKVIFLFFFKFQVFSLAERRGFLIKKEEEVVREEDAPYDPLLDSPEKKRRKREMSPTEIATNLDDVPDAVFQFKLAEIIYNQAMEAISEESKQSEFF